MPHFVIDCSENIIEIQSPDDIMQKVFDTAISSNLFVPEEVKVRINPFKYYKIGSGKEDFIHIFANIMEGRDIDQKKALSKSIISELNTMFPDVPIISINIRDFEKKTYFNKFMI